MTAAVPIRGLAFYLPQYHPTPENDEWWGEGFTEWTNVRAATPQFAGHYQPHVPADLGYYDLREPSVRQAQADLAQAYGLSGFVYYHYWFSGKRLLERPFAEVLKSGAPDFPFCLCWANENWTKTWKGQRRQILLSHTYSDDDDRVHIRSLLDAFSDPRYLQVDGKPVFLVHRSSLIPDARRTTDIWRQEAQQAGWPDMYLCRVESGHGETGEPTTLGFDAAVEFQPDVVHLPEPPFSWRALRVLSGRRGPYSRRVHGYDEVVQSMLAKPPVPYKRFPSVTPSWDNTPRRKRGKLILRDATPQLFEDWLTTVLSRFEPFSPEENFVFVNAWNEWGEGNHLEPDERWGHAWLEAYAAAAKRAGKSRM